MSRVLLVGEAPSRRGDPSNPLDPRLAGGAADRLRSLLGVAPEQFAHWFDRTNAFGTLAEREKHRGPVPPLTWPLQFYDFVIALGRVAGSAIQLPAGYKWLTWYGEPDGPKLGAAPHPSGLNRWYNDQSRASATREFLLEAVHNARWAP